ncbi:hypothetical protein CC2G_014221 [Coprinopsis cinerea AmutBmut pab1-1]|nr:hypothetical protein CC2G_014221 [Coprinopsis cinerea AmutBmut pab1-1]
MGAECDDAPGRFVCALQKPASELASKNWFQQKITRWASSGLALQRRVDVPRDGVPVQNLGVVYQDERFVLTNGVSGVLHVKVD